ncbi:MAG TPA: TMEM175 family protein, partial [Acetobacteraceae bacterium]|nr:TMEM175 family protein [Acetobacteraceae bacterium]
MVNAESRGRDVGRLNAFTDGVMVVAMTILILNIDLPETVGSLDSARLLAALVALWPRYLGYVLSFLVIGQYWLGYTRQFGAMRAADERFAELNILL